MLAALQPYGIQDVETQRAAVRSLLRAAVCYFAEPRTYGAASFEALSGVCPLLFGTDFRASDEARDLPEVPPEDLDLVEGRENPSRWIALLYEEVVRLAPGASSALSGQAGSPQRKAAGVYYTPPFLARQVVERVLEPLRGRPEIPRVFDPAMGTGVFLVEAVHALQSRYPALSPATIAERAMWGVDLDPLAVELAILSLWLEFGGDPMVLSRQLRCGDALSSGEVPGAPFDIVVGNPPWGATFTPLERAQLREKYPASTRTGFDSFKLFLDLGSACTGGTLGMVVPQAVLTQEQYEDVRATLLQRLRPVSMEPVLPGTFADAVAPACVLVLASPAISSPHAEKLAPSTWTASGFHSGERRVLDLLHHLQREHPCLGDLKRHYRIRDVGLNYNRAAVARRVLYCGPEVDPRDLPRYRGRNFHRYSGITSDGWLRHNAQSLLQPGETLSAGWSVFALAEKIVLRQTADRIIATLDRSRMVLGRSVIAITTEDGALLGALLACLNSIPLNALYAALAGERGRVLPQVKVGKLEQLPIPAVCLQLAASAPPVPAISSDAGAGAPHDFRMQGSWREEHGVSGPSLDAPLLPSPLRSPLPIWERGHYAAITEVANPFPFGEIAELQYSSNPRLPFSQSGRRGRGMRGEAARGEQDCTPSHPFPQMGGEALHGGKGSDHFENDASHFGGPSWSHLDELAYQALEKGSAVPSLMEEIDDMVGSLFGLDVADLALLRRSLEPTGQ